jgi:signal transduction histidine kinase
MTLSVEAPETLQALADPELLRIALTNYLTNAAKYGAENGQARLTVKERDEEIEVCVWNEGQGFTAEELSAQLEEIGADDSERAAFIQNILDNFDEADSDGDGRVNLQEAIAYNASDNQSASKVASSDVNSMVMMQIMQLMQAYNIGGSEEDTTLIVSVTA